MPAAIWTCVEPAVAITTACISHVRLVFNWGKQYLMVKRQCPSEFEPTEGNNSCSAINTLCALSFAEVDQTHTFNEIMMPKDSINLSILPSRNVSDFETNQVESAPPPSPGTSFSIRDPPSDWEGPTFPAVVALFRTRDPDGASTFYRPSTPQPTPTPSPRSYNVSAERDIGIRPSATKPVGGFEDEELPDEVSPTHSTSHSILQPSPSPRFFPKPARWSYMSRKPLPTTPTKSGGSGGGGSPGPTLPTSPVSVRSSSSNTVRDTREKTDTDQQYMI